MILEYHGRFQGLDAGFLEDVLLCNALTKNPEFIPDSKMMMYRDGRTIPASEGLDGIQGHIDGLALGIAGNDPPEEVALGREKDAERFSNPVKNPFTWFERLVRIKKLLAREGFPLESVDILPKFPHWLHPTTTAEFEPVGGVALQYIGVDSDHHYERLLSKGPQGRGIITLFHDYRNPEDNMRRSKPLEGVSSAEEINQPSYPSAMGLFAIGTGLYDLSKEMHSLETVLDRARKGEEVVVAITYFPTARDRRILNDSWGSETSQRIGTPFERYQKLRATLMEKNADPGRVHVTFKPFEGTWQPKEYAWSYLPRCMEIMD